MKKFITIIWMVVVAAGISAQDLYIRFNKVPVGAMIEGEAMITGSQSATVKIPIPITLDLEGNPTDAYLMDTPEEGSNLYTKTFTLPVGDYEYQIVFADGTGTNGEKGAWTSGRPFSIDEEKSIVFRAKLVNNNANIKYLCDAQNIWVASTSSMSSASELPSPNANGIAEYPFTYHSYKDYKLYLFSHKDMAFVPDLTGQEKGNIGIPGLAGGVVRWIFRYDRINMEFLNAIKLVTLLADDKIGIGESIDDAANLSADLGTYGNSNSLLLKGGTTSVSAYITGEVDTEKLGSAQKDNNYLKIAPQDITAKMYYTVTLSGDANPTSSGNQLLTTEADPSIATYETDWILDTPVNITSGFLVNGTYELKVWYETECHGDIIKSAEYTTTFSIKNPHTWTGSIDTTWGNAENWNQNSAPDNTADIIIPASVANVLAITTNTEVASLTMDFGAQINIAENKTLKADKITIRYLIPGQKWDAIGFPFAVTNIYCPEFKDKGWVSTLYPYGKTNEYGYSDFWLKEYKENDEKTDYVFSYTTELSENEGYIIQFPESFGSNIYTAAFEGMPPSGGFSNASVAEPAEKEYKLVANPTLGNISLTSGNNKIHYYQYNGKDFVKKTGDITLNAFESIISVKEPDNPDSGFVLRSLFSLGDGDGLTTLQQMVNEANDPVIEKRYYTLQGIEINAPSDNGIYIVKKTHGSGKETVQKEINAKK